MLAALATQRAVVLDADAISAFAGDAPAIRLVRDYEIALESASAGASNESALAALHPARVRALALVTTADHDDRVAGGDAAEPGAVPAGGEDVGEQHGGLVAHVDRAYVTAGQPGVLVAVRELFRRMDPAALTALARAWALELIGRDKVAAALVKYQLDPSKPNPMSV